MASPASLRRAPQAAAVLALLAAGCSLDATGKPYPYFTGDETSSATTTATTASGAGGTGTGGAGATTSGTGGLGGAPPFDLCDAPGLVACYPLDGSFDDLSGNEQHPEVVEGAGFVPGKQGGAAHFDATSEVHLPSAAVWEAPLMTMEMWLRLQELPADGERMGVIDKDGQVAVFVYPESTPGGMLWCGHGDLHGGGLLVVGEWTHVACVADGTTVRLYRDGVEVGSVPAGDANVTQDPIAIGSNAPDWAKKLIGDIDGLRVFKGPRTSDEICAAAGGDC